MDVISDISIEHDYINSFCNFAIDKINTVVSIELFFIKVDIARNFSQGVWPARYQCMLKVTSGGLAGWSELTLTRLERAVIDTERTYSEWLGLTIDDALRLCVSAIGRMPDMYLEAMELALIDLAARIRGVNAMDYLGLPKQSTSLPGLECILQKNPFNAVEQAKLLARTHLKIKLFGDIDHDTQIVKCVRDAIPDGCFLVADVNEGYLKDCQIEDDELEVLAEYMSILQRAGLDACEDPAKISFSQMAHLQSMVPSLPIIPDYLLRPAYKLHKVLEVVPGHIYNIHPHTMGSIRAMILLAKRILDGGGKLMIGDNSLIGAACTAWQQLACALGAEWCESIEKPLEYSDLFMSCVNNIVTRRDDSGICHCHYRLSGFGLEVDSEKLARNCEVYRMLEANREFFHD